MNIYDQIASNKYKTQLIVAIFILSFLSIGLGFDYYTGYARIPVFTLLAFFFGVILSYGAWRYGDKLILYSTHAKQLDFNDPKQKQWQNVVEEMSIAAGIPKPATYIIDDPDPNAFATGRNPENSSLVATQGLLESLNRDELQAVASHEMSHIKNFDIRLMLIIAVLAGSIALVSDWSRRMLFAGRRRSSRKEGGAAELIILAVWFITLTIAPILSQLMTLFVSRKREYLADASGAELTRNPLALASALEKIDSRVAPTRSISQGTAHLCICDPKGNIMGRREGWVAELFSTHPPVAKRTEALRQMAYIA